jgi:hypothetical protein
MAARWRLATTTKSEEEKDRCLYPPSPSLLPFLPLTLVTPRYKLSSSFPLSLSSNRGHGMLACYRRHGLLSPCPLCLRAPSFRAQSRDRVAFMVGCRDGGARGISGNPRILAVGVPDDGRSGTDSRWR